MRQDALGRSLFCAPRSHCSPRSIFPFPQKSNVMRLREETDDAAAEEEAVNVHDVEHASLLLKLPSSHCSPGSARPLPHTYVPAGTLLYEENPKEKSEYDTELNVPSVQRMHGIVRESVHVSPCWPQNSFPALLFAAQALAGHCAICRNEEYEEEREESDCEERDEEREDEREEETEEIRDDDTPPPTHRTHGS